MFMMGRGRRIESRVGNQTRKFLVAPGVGSGLDMLESMADGAGNLLTNYVYAGIQPLVRLDASGNSIYYLTDGMGSVIGLTDGEGVLVASFRYDGFGNLILSSGTATTPMDGDFRFQGQWLEEATGIYHFRARDYDAASGRFLSRDSVDASGQLPEAFNPYQFAFSNPQIFADPDGLITLIEINANLGSESVLSSLRLYVNNEVKQYLRQKAEGLITDVIWGALRSFLPVDEFLPQVLVQIYGQQGSKSQGIEFEFQLRREICGAFFRVLPKPVIRNLWIWPGVLQDGKAFGGLNCRKPDLNNPRGDTVPPEPISSSVSRPDFLFSPVPPRELEKGKPPFSWLIGDIKLSLKTAANDYASTGGNTPYKPQQFKAMTNHAKVYGTKIVGIVALEHGKQAAAQGYIAALQEEAVKYSVVLAIITIFN
jgi:RHS repeat-associated protein